MQMYHTVFCMCADISHCVLYVCRHITLCSVCVQMYHTVFCGTPSCVDILVVLISRFTEMTPRILPSPEVLKLFMVVHSHVAAH